MTTPNEQSTAQVVERISYVFLAIFALTGGGLFFLTFSGVKVDPVMLGVLGGFISAVLTTAAAVSGYWLASSAGSRDQTAKSTAALTQLAGAGPPPPADPNATPPADEAVKP